MRRFALLLAPLLASHGLPAAEEPAPKPLDLWLYYPTNLLVDKNVETLENVWRRAAAAGYSRVLLADSKFSRLGEMEPRYFKNVERVKSIARELKLEVVSALFSIGYSNDLLWQLKDTAKRMRYGWGARGYMMSHDEIRTLNWDASCRKRGIDAGAILAANARECVKLLEGSTAHVWSDMFDPHHNAHKDYYLVEGDLSGSWEGLSKDVVIVNWNFEKRGDSLPFFAQRGHKQVIAGYYDGPVKQARDWLDAAAEVEGVTGIMYTTWRNAYEDIEAFGKACRVP